MPFLEFLEHAADSHIHPRRLYVNTDRIAYITAHSERDPAILIFDDRTAPLVVDEPWLTVLEMIERET